MSIRRREWPIHRLSDTYALINDDATYEPRYRVLKNVTSGVMAFACNGGPGPGPTCAAVLTCAGVRRRWRRTLPGYWLVTRDVNASKGYERFRHRVYSLDGTGGHDYIRPPETLMRELDETEAGPIGGQLRASGFDEVASTPDGSIELYANDQLLGGALFVHVVSDQTARLLHGAGLVTWNPETRLLAYRRTPGQGRVPVPIGIGDSYTPFRGSIDDLVLAHPFSQQRESGNVGTYRWEMPSPHYHARDGTIVCGHMDGLMTDSANEPWPSFDRDSAVE